MELTRELGFEAWSCCSGRTGCGDLVGEESLGQPEGSRRALDAHGLMRRVYQEVRSFPRQTACFVLWRKSLVAVHILDICSSYI